MRMMKRLLAAALGVAMAASLFAGLNLHTFAADDTYTRAQMERVIADTAIAYYLKGPDGQYDSYTLSGLSKTKSCVSRLTFGVSPEECSPQRRFYTVCSSYPHLVYYEVFGQHPLLEADMANTELPGYSRMRRYAGPPESALTDEAMMYTLSYISLTSNYGAYGKKVADNRDGWVGKGGIVYYWGSNNYENITDAQYQEIKANVRPGDIISVVRGAEEDDDGENSGHTMIVLGDYKGDGKKYIIHSGGNKYNNCDNTFFGNPYESNNTGAIRAGVWTDDGTKTGNSVIGFDRVEDSSSGTRNGTIRITEYDATVGRGTSYGPQSSGTSVIKQFVVMRPLDRLIGWEGRPEDVSDDDKFPKAALTTNAFARRQYPGLEVTTVGDKSSYNDVQAGGTLTYSWYIENDTNITSMKPRYGASGRNYAGMTMTMPLPKNVTYLRHKVTNTASDGVDGSVEYDAPTHAVIADGFTSSAGATYRVDVTVQIPAGAKLGEKIELPAGRLTGPNTSCWFRLGKMTHIVGGAHPTGFDAITESSVVSSGARSKMDAANDVYAAAGYRLELPDTQSFLNAVLTYAYQPAESSRKMQSRVLDESEITDPDALRLRRMIVPEYIGGKKLFTANKFGVKTNENRLRDFSEDFLQPGDILVYAYTATSGTNSYSENSARAILPTIPEAERVYVYLGDSNYAYYDDEGVFRVIHAPVHTFQYTSAGAKGELFGFDRNGSTPSRYYRIEWSPVLTQAFRYSYFFCLRPSLVYGSLPVMAPSSSAAYTVESGGVTTGYASLADALAAAGAGSTLTLHEDTALTDDQTFRGGTLDLGGHTLTTGAYTLMLDAESAAQTLQNGTVTGSGDAVFCAGASATIRSAKLFGGTSGAAVVSADGANVTFENAELASANTAALPVRTASGGALTNWTFRNDVTLLVPSALLPFDGGGAALGTDALCYTGSRNAWYQIADAESAATYRPVTFTKDPTALNVEKNTFYASLSEAIDKASAGETIRLLRDLSISQLREVGTGGSYGRTVSPSNSSSKYALGVTRGMTIDFDGHTITGDSKSVSTTVFILGASPITLKNGTICAKTGWALNMTGREIHLDNMKLYTKGTGIVVSDSSQSSRVLYVENGSLVVSGLTGNSSTNSNEAVEIRHGTVVVRGGSRVGSLTGIAVVPNAVNATEEKPNTSEVIVEDGGLFTGRYAYVNRDSDVGYFDTTFNAKKNHATLTFLSDSDAHYMREEHAEETIEIPGSTTVVAVDRALKLDGEAQMQTQYSLNLNDKLVVNYYVADSENAYTDGSYVLADGKKIPLTREGEQLYAPVCESAAKELTHSRKVQPVGLDAGGTRRVGSAADFSVRGYAETILGTINRNKTADAKLGRALIALLDYGAEAQKYFGFETDDLANKNLTDADLAQLDELKEKIGVYRADKRTVNDPEGLYAASSCVLGSSQALRFYLNLPESRTDRASLRFRVHYDSYRDERHVAEWSFAELNATETEGVYFLEVPELRAADVLTNVTLTVEKNGSALARVTDSVASYCARVQLEQPETAGLADALIVYGLSALEHFGRPKPAVGENEMPIN